MRFVGCAMFCCLAAVAQEASFGPMLARGPKEVGPPPGTNLALPWPDGAPPVLWRAQLGEGFSGTCVAGDRIFTQMQTRAGQYVVCLDFNSGLILWQSHVNIPWERGGDFPGPYATPVCQGGKVYYADCYGQAGCLDALNGRNVWTVNLTKEFEGEGTGSGYACSPLIDGDRVILPVGGPGTSVVALSAQDGSIRWRSGDDAASYCTSQLIQVRGHPQVVSFLQDVLVAHDPGTGRELWRDRWNKRGYDEHNAAPRYQEPYLFCAASFKHGARVLKLGYEGETAQAELVWQNTVLCNDLFSSVLVGGCIYGSDVEQTEANPRGGTRSRFKCVELSTGRELWASAAPGHASVLVCDHRLLLLNEEGVLIVIAASPEGYHELTRAQVVEGTKPCWTTPTLCQGRLLARNQQTLVCCQIGAIPPDESSGKRMTGLGITASVGAGDPIRAGAFARTQDQSWLGAGLAWLDRHQNPAYWNPSPAVLASWFGGCLGLLGMAAGAAWLLRGLAGPWPVFAVLSVLLGILGLPICSVLSDRLIFTWPAASHACFILVLAAGCGAPGTGRLMPRIWLAVFVLGCVGYYFLCRQIFLLSGMGFLAGFLPALPVSRWFVRTVREKNYAQGAVAFILSFSLYFWGSAMIILWRMGR